MTGSRALAGVNEPSALEQKDGAGVTMREALTAFGGAPDRLAAAYAEGVAAFVEVHIEQGPVLEAEGRPLGVVNAINGATRLAAIVYGAAGHAGASPMNLRHDALAAAAEMILAIEARARAEIGRDLVATVGRLDVEAERGQRHPRPGALFDRRAFAARRMAPPRRRRNGERDGGDRGAPRRRGRADARRTRRQVTSATPRSSPASRRRSRRSVSSRACCPRAPGTTR